MTGGINELVQTLSPSNLLPILVALIFVGLLLRALLLERLRIKHHDTWMSLGRPTNFGSRKGSHELLHFVGIKGEFRRLNDGLLNVIVFIQRATVVAMIATFVGVIALALAGRK